MKTLIFYGSPHQDGDTMALLKETVSRLTGEVVMVDAYRTAIRPCADCRWCRKNIGCVIRDEMQQVYEDIVSADSVLVAAPIYFGEVPGNLLNVFSRLQAMFSGKFFLKHDFHVKPKRGGIILTGGGSGGEKHALETVKDIFHYYMNVTELAPAVLSLKTDTLPAGQDQEALRAAEKLGGFLNGDLNG